MNCLGIEEAKTKRNELVELGYTVVPGVLQGPLLTELRTWSDNVFAKAYVDPKYRYQGSDIQVHTERRWATMDRKPDEKTFADPIVEKIVDHPPQTEACRLMGLEHLRSHDVLILLSKPAFGPLLYWHQDYTSWNSPAAATPWPTRIFLSYYLTDTTRENGCLRVIPGTHVKRHKLHDILPDAHEAEMQAIDDLSHPAFADYPEAVDVPLKAGDLVIADARVMHGAWPNKTDQRRTLSLAWHNVFTFPQPPSWWTGPIPEVVKNADPSAKYDGSRTPSHYIK
jgi:ectoine hydroxylase-related dioxygenase (phytanoyl-CoA dioxygenase family)